MNWEEFRNKKTKDLTAGELKDVIQQNVIEALDSLDGSIIKIVSDAADISLNGFEIQLLCLMYFRIRQNVVRHSNDLFWEIIGVNKEELQPSVISDPMDLIR